MSIEDAIKEILSNSLVFLQKCRAIVLVMGMFWVLVGCFWFLCIFFSSGALAFFYALHGFVDLALGYFHWWGYQRLKNLKVKS